jgi:ectoine hydroxylase-related dioxygenase (phytanoyl-CoA dioxygenase family)
MEECVIIVENAIDEDLLGILRKDCDCFKALRLAYNPAEVGASIDPLEELDIPEDSSIRSSVEDYFKARWSDARISTRTHLSSLEQTAVIDLMTKHLPSILMKRIPHLKSSEGLFLFNEHYIVKDGLTEIAFRWHRDADEQLYAFSDADRPIYWSIWCPLDNCNEENGTLFLSEGALADNLDPSCRATKRKAEHMEADEQRFDDSYHGIPVVVSAGAAVIFSSLTWHRSSANMTNLSRRVLYVQYSENVISPCLKYAITNVDTKEETCQKSRFEESTPLNLALPCLKYFSRYPYLLITVSTIVYQRYRRSV